MYKIYKLNLEKLTQASLVVKKIIIKQRKLFPLHSYCLSSYDPETHADPYNYPPPTNNYQQTIQIYLTNKFQSRQEPLNSTDITFELMKENSFSQPLLFYFSLYKSSGGILYSGCSVLHSR